MTDDLERANRRYEEAMRDLKRFEMTMVVIGAVSASLMVISLVLLFIHNSAVEITGLLSIIYKE